MKKPTSEIIKFQQAEQSIHRYTKTVLTCVFGCLLSVQAFGQGRVDFSNTSSTRLSTNDFQGNTGFINGVNAYRIGLYIAPSGTADESVFTLVAPIATNQVGGSAGRFNGNVNILAEFPIAGNTGQTIAFQVRAWSLFAGETFEEAVLYNGFETVYVGKSTIGTVTPTTGLAPPELLFGTGGGRIGGFTLTPLIIPEPSAVTLAVVGATALWFATRRRRK